MAVKEAKLKAKAKKNVFASAAVINQPEEKKKKKDNKREVDLGTNLDISAAIDALTTALNSIKETIDEEIKDKMTAEFVAEAHKTQRKPESFRGVSEKASASCEIRKRSTRSVLKPEEVDILRKYGLEIETKEIKPAVPEHYVINPKALEDVELVEEISSRLEGLTTKDGQGIIMLQEGREAETAEVVGNNILNEAAKKIKKKHILEKVFNIVAVNALGKYNLKDSSLSNIFAILMENGIDASFTTDN
jgi:hypothetical protein